MESVKISRYEMMTEDELLAALIGAVLHKAIRTCDPH